jgi:hypothetical protein
MTALTIGRRAHATSTNPDGRSARAICNWYWSRRLTMTIGAPPAPTHPQVAR